LILEPFHFFFKIFLAGDTPGGAIVKLAASTSASEVTHGLLVLAISSFG